MTGCVELRARSSQAISREVGYTKGVALTQEQKDVLVGLLLGDGSLEFDKFKASRLQIKQAESRAEYVFWLHDFFRDITKTPPQQRKDTKQWYFGTRYVRDLESWRSLFYLNGKKIVPSTIEELIQSPATLAIWFMDDGTLDYRERYHYSFSLSTDSFSREEVKILSRVLWNRFGIKSSVQYPLCRGKRYAKLYIGKDGRDVFLKIIQPFVLSCFSYKLPPQHRLTPQRLSSMM